MIRVSLGEFLHPGKVEIPQVEIRYQRIESSVFLARESDISFGNSNLLAGMIISSSCCVQTSENPMSFNALMMC